MHLHIPGQRADQMLETVPDLAQSVTWQNFWSTQFWLMALMYMSTLTCELLLLFYEQGQEHLVMVTQKEKGKLEFFLNL